jgi:electron transport complex protein RnfG
MKTDIRKEIVRPAFVLFAICLIVTVCLALTNAVTKDAIAAQAEKDAQTSRLAALPSAETFEKYDGAENCYVGKEGGETVGWVFTTSASSYGGEITVATGISKEGKVTGVVLESTSDTPGLGLNAQKDSFRSQYRQDVPANGFEVVKGTAGSGQISALTGATISSRAVTSAVNEAVAQYQKIKGGE